MATSPAGTGKSRSDPTRIWRDPCFFLERRKVARSRRTRPPSPPRRTGRIAMIFWDASAVLPLCVQEDPSPLVRDLLLGDPAMVAWWGTPVECCSALACLQREGHLDRQAVSRAVRFLDSLRAGWSEILPSHQVREGALRCISVHGLKAAGLVAIGCRHGLEQLPTNRTLLCLFRQAATTGGAQRGFSHRADKRGLGTR